MQEEQLRQMENRRKMISEYANEELELEKNIIREDLKKADEDATIKRTKKAKMASTLREYLL